jgi:hypothetical protein
MMPMDQQAAADWLSGCELWARLDRATGPDWILNLGRAASDPPEQNFGAVLAGMLKDRPAKCKGELAPRQRLAYKAKPLKLFGYCRSLDLGQPFSRPTVQLCSGD